MANDGLPCPECGSPLEKVTGTGAVSHACPACGGHLYGLSPFERLLVDGAGARLWVASGDGPLGGRCPYCGNAMKQPPDDPGGPAGLCMCHLCEQVWVPSGAAAWMTANAAPGAVAAAPAPPLATQCATCGAPLEPDELGRCRYCHAQVAAPQPVVIEVPTGQITTGTGSRLLDGLVALFTEPIQ